MKTSFWRAAIIILCICILSCFLSCGMEESYKEFYIKGITDNLDENYFASDTFEFAKMDNAVIIPEFKELNFGVWIIYLSAYSETGLEDIIVKDVIMTEGKRELLNLEVNEEIVYELNPDGIYEGEIAVGPFTEEQIEVASGKEYGLVVNVESKTNVGTVSKNITFDTVIKGYRSFVFPT